MVSIKRLVLVLVMTVLFMETKTVVGQANSQLGGYTEVAEKWLVMIL